MVYYKKMVRIFLFIVISLFPSVVSAQPAITFAQQSHDFGTIAPADSIAHDFEFSNSGTEDLVIEKLVPS